MVGAGRAYDYDSSESVGSFIATRSLLDPFRRQLQFNNHPFFSFLEHLVYSAGGSSETAMRVLPTAAAAATVGLVVGWIVGRWGWLAGLAGGLLLAANPTFASLGRSVRGYSLLTLALVCATVLLERLLVERRGGEGIAYTTALAIAIATHLYALCVLLGHVLVVVVRREADRRWLLRWVAAVVVGGLAYSGMAGRMVAAARSEQHRFQSAFPLHVGAAVLGSTPAAIAVVACLTCLGLLRARRSALAALAVVVAVLGVDWAVVAPTDLYPRFLVWLIPVAAVAAAAAIRRSAWLLGPAVVAAVAMVAVDIPNWTVQPLPGPAAAELLGDARQLDATTCALPDVRGLLMAYTAPPAEVKDPRSLARCTLAIASPVAARALRAAARRSFPHRWLLVARTSLVVYARFPRTYFEERGSGRIATSSVGPLGSRVQHQTRTERSPL
jgi:hypothetical protein